MAESTNMASVPEIEYIEIKVEPIFSDYEEKSCESPKVKVKTEHEELEDPIKNTAMVEIEVPAATKIESETVQVESVFCNNVNNMPEEKCREENPYVDLARNLLKRRLAELGTKICSATSEHEERAEQGEASRGFVKAGQAAARPSLQVWEQSGQHTDITSNPYRQGVEEDGRSKIYSIGTVNSQSHVRSSISQEQSIETPFKCNVCMKCFMRKADLNVHSRIHTGIKPFKCDVCFKSFGRKCILERHYLTHTDEKPYKCDVCMKDFARKSSLDIHYRIHNGNKPYQCNVCLKCFRRKTHLDVHNRVHTGEKPYKCDLCMKTFRGKCSLKKHYRLHSDSEKRYKCSMCTKCFREKATLDLHYGIHTGDKPYHCDFCNTGFNHKGSLIRHISKNCEKIK